MNISPLQTARYEYAPKLPGMLRNGIADICVCEGAETQSVADQEKIKALFPNTYGKKEITFQKGQNTSEAKKQVVGVILSGGQAPGGHNVISGLFDGIKALNADSKLYGFILGPGGLVDHNYMELTSDIIDEYRNTGGFDIIGSGRTKLEKEEQFDKGLEILTPEWAARLDTPSPAGWDPRHRTLARYFVDRYWLQAISDFDLVSRAKLAIISCLVVKSLGGDLIETAQLYSKEIENSIENVEVILDAAYENPIFGDGTLSGLLLE